MKIWTQSEEAENLRRRFEGVNRAEFARKYKVKGGQSYIYQHIQGIRPISIEAAKAYATGFGCTLQEISPRLAAQVAEASELSSYERSDAARGAAVLPFRVSLEDLELLTSRQRDILSAIVDAYVRACLEEPKRTARAVEHVTVGKRSDHTSKKAS